MNRYAWIADIEKAFLNIAPQPTDVEEIRFLWFTEPNKIGSSLIALKWKEYHSISALALFCSEWQLINISNPLDLDFRRHSGSTYGAAVRWRLLGRNGNSNESSRRYWKINMANMVVPMSLCLAKKPVRRLWSDFEDSWHVTTPHNKTSHVKQTIVQHFNAMLFFF